MCLAPVLRASVLSRLEPVDICVIGATPPASIRWKLPFLRPPSAVCTTIPPPAEVTPVALLDAGSAVSAGGLVPCDPSSSRVSSRVARSLAPHKDGPGATGAGPTLPVQCRPGPGPDLDWCTSAARDRHQMNPCMCSDFCW